MLLKNLCVFDAKSFLSIYSLILLKSTISSTGAAFFNRIAINVNLRDQESDLLYKSSLCLDKLTVNFQQYSQISRNQFHFEIKRYIVVIEIIMYLGIRDFNHLISKCQLDKQLS